MLWAACCLGFFGFLRAGEFTVNSVFQLSTHMTVDDLQADSLVNPACFKVHIKCSKTDPFRVGCDIYLGHGEGSVCPVVELGNCLSLRGSALTRQQLSSTVQSILHAAGYSGTYSAHSFRIRAATTAAAHGVPDHLIKTLDCWSIGLFYVLLFCLLMP